MKKAAIVSVGIFILGAGGLSFADSRARHYAEEQVADELQDRLGLSSPPHVEIDGWPFAVRAAQGSIPSMKVSEDETIIDGQSISGIVIHAQDVEFDDDSAHVGRARGTIELSGADLTEMIAEQGYQETIAIDGEILTVSRPGVSVSGRAEGTIRHNRLTVVPSTDQVDRFTISLPRVVRDIRYRTVRVADSLAVVAFTATNVDLAGERLK